MQRNAMQQQQVDRTILAVGVVQSCVNQCCCNVPELQTNIRSWVLLTDATTSSSSQAEDAERAADKRNSLK